MLKKILAITGRPGLFKLIGQGKNIIIVEDLQNGRRSSATSRDKLISLGDIAMYTDSGDKPLGEILNMVYAALDGKPADIKALSAQKGFRDKFGEIVSDFDRDRVYESDAKKLFQWYNMLLEAGFTHFTEKEAEADAAEENKEEAAE